MSENLVWIDFNLMEEFMSAVLQKVGVPEADAKICTDVLISADKKGIDSHGIGRLKPIYYDRIKDGILNPQTKIDIIRDRPTTAVLDGNNGMGQVIAYRAMEMAIEKAKQFGMGMVAVRNSSHYGIAGYYVDMACSQGMIGVTGTNARPSIAPTFGVENMLGTNPLVFGIPTDEDFPFIIDCATSTTQRGKIEIYERDNKEIPPDWVIDLNGQTRTDTSQILKDLVTGAAALTPLGGIGEELGGHKGYGYAAVVEILSAALQSGSYLKALTGFNQAGEKQPYQLGHFFIAIQVEAFNDLNEFKQISGDILRQLRASKKAPGYDRIYTAGEKEHEAWLERKDQGVPLNEPLRKQILQLKKELNLNQFNFPFE